MRVACLWFATPTSVEKVAELCLRFSPQICIRKDQALFIEIGKCYRLYSEDGFRARVAVILRRMNVSASLALGDDITEALLKARFATSRVEALPLTALMDLADPFNRDPVLQKYVQRMIASFEDLGIKTLQQFQNIPVQDLSTRFGAVGILCQQRLRQESRIPWPNWVPEETIIERSEFPYFEFYGELEPILFELKKQLDQIFQRLWARNLKAQTLQIRIFCEINFANPHRYRNFDFDFLFPQSNTKGALNIIKERLSRDFQKTPILSPIEALECSILQTVTGTIGQKNFLHNREEVSEQLHSLLNQLSESHGKKNIFHAKLTEERLPEKSWQKVHGLIPQETSVRASSQKTQKPQQSQPKHLSSHSDFSLDNFIPLRPTHLMRAPERIEVNAQFIFIRKKPYRILHWSEETERISGGWLESNHDTESLCYDRNYSQVELEKGVLVWVFQDPSTQDFYLHGYFG